MSHITETTQSDEMIATAVQEGNVDAFGEIIRRYEEKMKRYARRFLFGYDEADDIIQEVFIKAYMNIKSFDVSRKFSPWIYRIAHNEFVNEIRKRSKEKISFFEPDTLFPHPVAKENPEHDAEAKEMKVALETSLSLLDPKYREPLVLFYMEDLSYKEIADVMGIPVATVGIRIKRGKETLRSHYENQQKARI